MLHWPVTQPLCLSLSKVMCNFVSDWVAGAKPQFFFCFYKPLKFGTAMIIQVSLFSIHSIAQKLEFSWPFCKVLSFYNFRKNVLELTLIQTSTVPHNFVQNSRTSSCLLCRFLLFRRTQWISLEIPINENSQHLDYVFICQLRIYYKAKHSVPKIEIGNGRQKDFYVKAKKYSSRVTKQTWNRSNFNCLTAATIFNTMW